MPNSLQRRTLLGSLLAASGASLLGVSREAHAERLAARPPAGFTRLALPGKVVKVTKPGSLQVDGLWPTQAVADAMLQRLLTELTGKRDLGEAFSLFVHKDDQVAIKPNGITGKKTQKMATSKELVLAVVKGVMAAGVPAESITIYEQFNDFLRATRVVDAKLDLDPSFPRGIKATVHLNRDAVMKPITVAGASTQYVRPFTEATAVINLGQVKDHSNCGYTGAMKNITHGSIINPQAYHAHQSSPQIAVLYAHEIVRSRVALHIADAYQVIFDKGPIDQDPKTRVPYEALLGSTDPVALDVVGWEIVDGLRQQNSLPTLEQAGRAPTYIRVAGDLGLGIFDRAKIQLREIRI